MAINYIKVKKYDGKLDYFKDQTLEWIWKEMTQDVLEVSVTGTWNEQDDVVDMFDSMGFREYYFNYPEVENDDDVFTYIHNFQEVEGYNFILDDVKYAADEILG